MTGQRFQKLVCIKPVFSIKKGSKKWLCKCDCGETKEILRVNLISGETTSCGCIQKLSRILNGKKVTKHGHRAIRSRTYITWEAMRMRCNNHNSNWFHCYGGRGIKVCKRWNKFENFLADMGVRPKGKTIDRIRVNGNYTPSNCRWATPTEQNLNRRKK